MTVAGTISAGGTGLVYVGGTTRIKIGRSGKIPVPRAVSTYRPIGIDPGDSIQRTRLSTG